MYSFSLGPLRFLRGTLLALSVLGLDSGAAQAAINIVSTVPSAGMATITLNSSRDATGHLTLLQGSVGCGSVLQTQTGKNGTDAAAYRRGSLALAAGTDAHYTVRNLAQASSFTVCATNGTDSTSASFSTTAMAAFGSAVWVKVGNARFSAGMATNQSLAFAPDGTPYVAYSDVANGIKTTVMRFNAAAVSPAWESVGIAAFSDMADNQSLSIAPDGTPYVAYRDIDGGKRTTVMRFNGTHWEIVGSAGFSALNANFQALAIAPDGAPYVAYRDTDGGNKTTVMRFNGTHWEIVGSAGFSAGGANNQSLAFAPDGTPYVAFKEDFSGFKSTTVMRFNAAAVPPTWENVGMAGGFPLGMR